MKISFFDAAGTLPYLYSTGDAIARRQAACCALELKGPPNPNKNVCNVGTHHSRPDCLAKHAS